MSWLGILLIGFAVTDLTHAVRRIRFLPESVGALVALCVGVLAGLTPLVPRTGVVAIARRPRVDVEAVLADPGPAPAVLLERPKNMGNIGACIRVAAAAGAEASADARRRRRRIAPHQARATGGTDPTTSPSSAQRPR